jgi:hypothetical protein
MGMETQNTLDTASARSTDASGTIMLTARLQPHTELLENNQGTQELLEGKQIFDALTLISADHLRDATFRLFFAIAEVEKNIADAKPTRMGLTALPSAKIDITDCLSAAREAVRIGTDFAFYSPILQEVDIQRKQWSVMFANLAEDLLLSTRDLVDENGKLTKDSADSLSLAFTESKKTLRALATNLSMAVSDT